MILITTVKNEATFCTHVYSFAVMSVENLKLQQWIIRTNPDIVGSYIQFYDKNIFDLIHLNCALDEE